jgi:hypothetical protein
MSDNSDIETLKAALEAEKLRAEKAEADYRWLLEAVNAVLLPDDERSFDMIVYEYYKRKRNIKN